MSDSEKPTEEASQSITTQSFDEVLEDGIENIALEDIPCSSGSVPHLNSSCFMVSMPHCVQLPKLGCQERYDIFCKDMKLADCRPTQVLNRVHSYIEENLMNKKWLAVWKGPYDGTTCRTVDILVEVDDVCLDQAHISLVDPLVCSEPSVPRAVVHEQLEELDFTLDIVELYPVSILSDDIDEDSEVDDESAILDVIKNRMDEQQQQQDIARVVDNVRFFFDHIRRDWDDEDEGEHAYDAFLRARLKLYFDVVCGHVPASLIARYNRTMAKYFVRRRELLDYQSKIQSEGEPTTSEAVECWRRYYEVLMLSGLLQVWETFQLRAEGPCFPRVLRRTKGPRKDNSTVTHVVAETLSLSMLKSFPDETIIQQHKIPLTALEQAHEGDLILIFPGSYTGEGFHELTESITIKGEGKRDEIVIEAVPYDDLFVNVCASDVVLENLTFVQADNTEGVLRVESGHAQVISCAFKCDGSGITVHEGAHLTMKESEVTGAKGAGVELMAGSVSVLENNKISNVGYRDMSAGHREATKGGVHLQVYEPPKVRLSGNVISSLGGQGITVGKKNANRFGAFPTAENVADGDGGDATALHGLTGKAGDGLGQFIDLDTSNNVIENQST